MSDTFAHRPRLPIEFRTAWRKSDSALEADADRFWGELNLLPADEQRQQRLSELCVMGYGKDGGLLVVSTARTRFIDFLNCNLTMFRCAVSPEGRRARLATVAASAARDVLEAWYAEHPEEAVMGMGMITQNSDLLDRGPIRGWLRTTRMALIGWTAQGEPMRVGWFEHARIAVPPTPATAWR